MFLPRKARQFVVILSVIVGKKKVHLGGIRGYLPPFGPGLVVYLFPMARLMVHVSIPGRDGKARDGPLRPPLLSFFHVTSHPHMSAASQWPLPLTPSWPLPPLALVQVPILFPSRPPLPLLATMVSSLVQEEPLFIKIDLPLLSFYSKV